MKLRLVVVVWSLSLCPFVATATIATAMSIEKRYDPNNKNEINENCQGLRDSRVR